MGKKNPLEDEFYNSMLYKNLNDVGGKVAQGIGKAVEEVGKAIGNGVPNGKFNRVNPPRGPQQPPPSYNPPPPRAGYQQDQSGNYRYVPPKGKPAPGPQGYTPPRQQPPKYGNPFAGAAQPGVRQQGVKPVPPPKPIKFKKKGYGGRRFLFTAAAVCTALAILPLLGAGVVLVPAAIAAGIGGYFLSRLIFRDWSRKPKPEAVSAQAAAPSPAVPKQEEQPRKKRSDTGNEELDKIIDEGTDYIEKLRKSNDAIADEGISGSIDRMEKACRGIFDYVKENPAKIPQIKKFLNYYLPTTLKLLASYEKLSRQTVKGETISSTMFDIEGMMQTIAVAFEKQLDGLFGDEAMDIQADIAVFESILQQEGLKDESQVQLK